LLNIILISVPNSVSGNRPYAVGKAKINEDMFSSLRVAWSREKGMSFEI
jgi:hypothetical protein